MTPEEIGNLYIRIAFQHESILDRLISKRLIGRDLADRARKTFYDTLNGEKLRTTQKISNHTEIIRRYIRGIMTVRKTNTKGESTVVGIQNCSSKTVDVINTYWKIAKL